MQHCRGERNRALDRRGGGSQAPGKRDGGKRSTAAKRQAAPRGAWRATTRHTGLEESTELFSGCAHQPSHWAAPAYGQVLPVPGVPRSRAPQRGVVLAGSNFHKVLPASVTPVTGTHRFGSLQSLATLHGGGSTT